MTPASLSKLVTPVILGCLGALILSLTWAWAFSISCSTASIFPDTAVSWSTASSNCFLSASVLACNRIFLDMSARCSPVTRLYSWRLLLSCLAGDSSSCPLGGGIPASRNNLCASSSACSHKAAIASLYLSPLMERPGGEIISQSPSPVLCELRNWLAAWCSAARCADLLLPEEKGPGGFHWGLHCCYFWPPKARTCPEKDESLAGGGRSTLRQVLLWFPRLNF